MIRYRSLAVTIWVALALFGFYANAHIDSLLTTSITVPKSGSADADALIKSAYGENSEGSFSIIYKYDSKSSKEYVKGLQAKLEKAANTLPFAYLVQNRAINGILYGNLQTNYDLQEATKYTDIVRKSLINAGLQGVKVTGPPAIKSDVSPILKKDLRRGQLIAILIAIIFLAITLRSIWSIFVPMIVAITTISTSIGAIYLLAHKFLMVLYIPNIVELIGLGLAIDYSLLMVHRYKLDGDIKETQRTILLSGTTVAIALSSLILVPIPFIRSLGIAGVIVPIVAMAATLTLQPALLSFLGQEGAKPRFATLRFQRIASFVVKRPLPVAVISLLVILIPASQVSKLSVTPSSISAIPSNLESAQAIKMLTDKAGEGIVSPIQILIQLPNAVEVADARKNFVKEITKNKDVVFVSSDPSYIDKSGKVLRVFVISRKDLGQSQPLISYLRGLKGEFPTGTKIYVGGAPAQGVDLINKLKSSFPWIALMMLMLSFALLRRNFRSLLIPFKAIVLDLISITAAVGTMLYFMRNGVGVYKLDQVEIWTLLFIFAILFGLSMDYEVFIVSRIRESYLQHGDNNRAIVEGIANTGGVVTTAAFVMIGALTGFVSGHFAGLQELGIGLVAGIAIDATIIRLLLLPATMALLGKWNWSYPGYSPEQDQ